MKIKYLFVLILFSIAQWCPAQNELLEFDDHIYVSSFSQDSSKIAVGFKNRIAIVNTASLVIEDEIDFIEKRKDYEIYDLKFQNDDKELLISTFLKDQEHPTRLENMEYLKDLKISYSLEDEIILGEFSGNFFQDIKGESIKVSGTNELVEELISGKTLRLSRNDRMTMDDQQMESEEKDQWLSLFEHGAIPDRNLIYNHQTGDSLISSGQIRDIKIISEDLVSVLFLDSVGSTKNHYRLETLSLPSFNKLGKTFFSSKDIVNKISISEDKDLLLVSGSECPRLYDGTQNKLASRHERMVTNNFYKIFKVESLETPETVSQSQTIPGILQNSHVWRIVEGDITSRSYNDNKLKTVINSSDLPFLRVRNLFKLTPNELIIIGSGSLNEDETENYKNGILKYPIHENSLDNALVVKSDTLKLFDPSEAVIQTNSFDYSNFQMSSNNDVLLAYDDNSLDVWNVQDKRRLVSLSIDKLSNAHLSEDGKEVLLFTSQINNRHSFFMGKLDLETGSYIKKELLYSETSFSPFSSLIIPYDANSFRIIKREGIWNIELDNLKVESLVEKTISEETVSVKFKILNESEELISFATYTVDYPENSRTAVHDLENVWQYNIQRNELEKLSVEADYTDAFSFSEDKILLYDGKRYETFSLDSSASRKHSKIRFDREIKEVRYNDHIAFIFYDVEDEYGNVEKTRIIEYDTNKEEAEREHVIEKEIATDETDFLNNEIVLISGSGLYSYYPEEKGLYNWNSMPDLPTIDAISVSDEKLLLNDYSIINLQNLSIRSYNQALKNQGSYELMAPVLLESSRILYAENYFDYIKFNIRDLEDIHVNSWESDQVKTEQTSIDFIKVSDNKEFAIAGKNYLPERLFLIDIKNRTVTKLKIPFEAEYVSKDNLVFDQQNLYLFRSESSYSSEEENEYTTHILDLEKKKFQKPVKDIQVIGNLENTGLAYFDWTSEESVIQIGKFTRNGPELSKSLKTLGIPNRLVKDPKRNIYIADYSDLLLFWDHDSEIPFKTLDLGKDRVKELILQEDKIFALLWNNELVVVDLDSLEISLRTFVFDMGYNLELASITNEGEFMASTFVINNFHFVKDLKSYPLSNYEILLNRPDKVLGKLGYADQDIIKIYEEAFTKRISRTNINRNSDIFSTEKPSVNILKQSSLPRVSKSATLDLDLEISDEKSELADLKISINGVPVKQRKIEGQSVKFTETLDLNAGLNQIKISATNTEGVKSDPVAFQVNREADIKPTIHYFGIGVSKYEDQTMNLEYADVDIKSISKYLKEKFSDQIAIDTLLNENVTKANLNDLREKIEKTEIDDIVILSFSGHGLVDDEQDFYFATHDIDFENPAEKGFSYSEIESLLANIPARRKLILLDACNSGEIDSEEELEMANLADENVKQHIPRGSKVVKSSKSTGLKTSFELMKSLFRDTEEGNGAFVISAAGGREFAYESDEWNNGVFTYSFIAGMEELGSRYRGDGTILISELQNYIYENVVRLTEGLQQPTTRRENAEWNWQLN